MRSAPVAAGDSPYSHISFKFLKSIHLINLTSTFIIVITFLLFNIFLKKIDTS